MGVIAKVSKSHADHNKGLSLVPYFMLKINYQSYDHLLSYPVKGFFLQIIFPPAVHSLPFLFLPFSSVFAMLFRNKHQTVLGFLTFPLQVLGAFGFLKLQKKKIAHGWTVFLFQGSQGMPVQQATVSST